MKRFKTIISRIAITLLVIAIVLPNTQLYALQVGDGTAENEDSINIGQSVTQSIYGTESPTGVLPSTPTPNATPTTIPSIPQTINLDFSVTDSVKHPLKPIIYMTSSENKKVYALNYETNQLSSITLDLAPEKLTFENNEIYVALIKSGHDYYTTSSEQGAVAIINPDTFQLVEQFDVGIDPFDIVADKNGFIYIISGTNQWTSIKGFSRVSKQEVSSGSIRMQSYAQMHPTMNRIYTIDTDVSPRDYEAFNITNDGKFSGSYDSPYHGDYPFTTNFKISPDGKYNFNGSGVILSCSENDDLKFVFKLNKGFNDIAFDLDHDRFYTAIGNNQVYVYQYSTFRGLDVVSSMGTIQKMYFDNNCLAALSKTNDNKWMLEKINISSGYAQTTPVATPTFISSPTYTSIPTQTYNTPMDSTTPIASTTPNLSIPIALPSNAKITDTVINPTKPVMYAVDNANSKVYAINYELGTISEVTLNLPPERIAFANNELYVTLLKGQHSSYWWDENQEGAIGIINADNMTLIDQFDVNIDPCDIAADDSRYIYVASGSGQWTTVKSYSGISKQEISSVSSIREMSNIEYNKILNKLYVVNDEMSSAEIYEYTIVNGILTGRYSYYPLYSYDVSRKCRVSPDGKYIFYASGSISKCDADTSKESFFMKLNKSFSDVAFDSDNNRFYTAVGNKQLYVYDYNTFIGTDTLQCKGNIQDMYYKDNAIIALSLNDENKPVVEQISLGQNQILTPTSTLLPSFTPTPTSTLSPSLIPTTLISTSTPIPTPVSGYIDIGANVSKTAINTQNRDIYIIDNQSNSISLINYSTGSRVDKKEYYKPTGIAYSNGQLIVGFGDQGYIGIYDPVTLKMTEQIFTGYNFGDIAVGNDGYVYTAPSSSNYNSSYVKSFSCISKQEISSCYVSGYGGDFTVNPVENIMYIGNSLFKYNEGIISTSNGSYSISISQSQRNGVSPDGKYVFNASGNVYTKDLNFYFKLNKQFNDVAFDINNNRFYTGIDGKMVYSYDYNSLIGIDTITTKGTVKQLYFSDNNLIAVSQLDSGVYGLELIDTMPKTPTPTVTPTSTVAPVTINPNTSNIPTPTPTPIQWNYSIGDSVINQSKPVIYFIDNSKNILASYNYETKNLNTLQLYYSPNSIDYIEGQILVGFGDQGMIAIYDPDTLQMKGQIITGMTFFDFALGRDGYIYVSGSSLIKSFSLLSKQEISAVSVSSSNGKIEMHPTRNNFYVSSSSSASMNMYRYESGNIFYDNYYKDSSGSKTTGYGNRISPDGCYLFNNNGGIFISSASQKYDLRYITSLSEGGFSDICFNSEKDSIYAASKASAVVVIYKSSTFGLAGTINLKAIPSFVYTRNGNLISLSGKGVEIVQESSAVIFTPRPVTPTPAPGIMLPANAIITDVLSHPSKPYVYAADPAGGRIILTNLETGEKKEIKVDGSPERLCYYNNEIYAGFGDMSKIMIYDAETLEYKSSLQTTSKFLDFVIGNDGFIYTSPLNNTYEDGYIRSYSRISKQEISSISVYWNSGSGYISTNPKLNTIYIANTSFAYNNGTLSQNSSYSQGSYSNRNFVSSDGKYIINDLGNVYVTSEDKTKDLKYLLNIGVSQIKDIAFDTTKNRFYVVNGTSTISVYNYTALQKLTTIQLKGNAERIFYNGLKLLTLSKDGNNTYYVENVNIDQDPRPNDVIIPTNLSISQVSKDSIKLKWINETQYQCMIEYGTSSSMGSKTAWAENPLIDHSFTINGLSTNTKYYFKIHYKINNTEMVSDLFDFTTSDFAYIDVRYEIDKVIYDNINNKAYAYNQSYMKLFVINLENHELEKTILLGDKPSDMCLSKDSKMLYVINTFGNVTVFDGSSLDKVEDISLNLPKYDDNGVHYHIYFNKNKLYLVDGNGAPGLWVYDIAGKQLKDFTSTVNSVGSIVFSSSGNEFYYWYQYGWSAGYAGSDVYKCRIDDAGDISIVNKSNIGYSSMLRDPLDTPIFLDESQNKIYCKDLVLDVNSFEIKSRLLDTIYGISSDNQLLVGKNKLYNALDLSIFSTTLKSNAKNVFFDNTRNIYMTQTGDTRIYYNPIGFKISGYIKPNFDCTDSRANSGFKVELEGTTYSATTDFNGYFEIANISLSNSTTYTLKISKDNYLTRRISNIQLNRDINIGVQDSPISIWVGDIITNGEQDGVINLGDIMKIATLFGSTVGDARYNELLDLNKDEAINLADIMLIAGKFNTSAKNYPDVNL